MIPSGWLWASILASPCVIPTNVAFVEQRLITWPPMDSAAGGVTDAIPNTLHWTTSSIAPYPLPTSLLAVNPLASIAQMGGAQMAFPWCPGSKGRSWSGMQHDRTYSHPHIVQVLQCPLALYRRNGPRGLSTPIWMQATTLIQHNGMHVHKCVNLKKAANIQDDANSFGSRHTSDQKNTD